MSETTKQHTPGPWLVARNGKAGHTFRIWRNNHAGELSPKGQNEGYACISTSVWGEPNARLVSAAPDLLHACKLILAASESIPPETFAVVKAAIAKAEGKGENPK